MTVQEGEMKLTQKGNLTGKAIRELYEQGFMADYWLDFRNLSRIRESDSESVTLTRIITQTAGLVKKRHNRLSLTASGYRLLEDPQGLFHTLLVTFVHRYIWAVLDRYGIEGAFRKGFAFSLILVGKYGSEKRPVDFYADKYIDAFPDIFTPLQPRYENENVRDSLRHCYSLRTFERFMCYVGLVEFERERGLQGVDKVMVSGIFHKLVKISPPGGDPGTGRGPSIQ